MAASSSIREELSEDSSHYCEVHHVSVIVDEHFVSSKKERFQGVVERRATSSSCREEAATVLSHTMPLRHAMMHFEINSMILLNSSSASSTSGDVRLGDLQLNTTRRKCQHNLTQT
jgi:hypothetical protein